MIKKFKFICEPQVFYGNNSVSLLPSIVKETKRKKLLVVVDSNFSKTSFFRDIEKKLSGEKIDFVVFDKISGEPTTDIGDECAEFGKENKCDIVCGIGGGSSLDVAKASSVIITNGGCVKDYQGLNKVPGPGLPKIMIPTTAGTGSEVTFTAVFIREDTKEKGGINSPYLYPEYAILDPVLTVSLPTNITSSTGLDALCHAIESYISKNSNFLSESISLCAIKYIWENLPIVYSKDEDLKAREKMLYGSFLAGLGLVNAGVTAVHSISYPLGGVYRVPHGVGNGLLLPYVLEFDIKKDISYTVERKLSSIVDIVRSDFKGDEKEKAKFLVDEIKNFLKLFKMPKLRDFNIDKENFSKLAEDALKVSVPIMNNPVAIKKEDIIEIYNNAY
ncbi:MAG TPA: iron-containing alcohol dehydrogenase [bacterium]|nr:iron-containing alcohol dehydrogenase [bacterium]